METTEGQCSINSLKDVLAGGGPGDVFDELSDDVLYENPSSEFWQRPTMCGDPFLNSENVVSYSHMTSWMNSDNRLSLDSILRAVRIYDVAKETPLDYGQCLSDSTGNHIWLKREDLQPVFSFKLRGAYNKIASLSRHQRKRGVTACSAGNHAQGVAYSAKHLNLSAKIFMPTITPIIKVDAVKHLGAEVVLSGNLTTNFNDGGRNGRQDKDDSRSTFDEAAAACQQCVIEEGRILVHPFDDLDVIAGQGVIGLEILKQHHSRLDAVFIAVGGGGMIAGIGSCFKEIIPDTKIIGVEGVECPGMTESLRAGRIVTLNSIGTFADGAAVKTVGKNTFRICYNGAVIDETILVNTDEICAAIKDSFNDVRVIVEPAGALAIAGMKKYIKYHGCKNQSFVAILSGANIDFNRLRFISTRADTTEHLIGVVIPERPGMFRTMYDLVAPRCVSEFSYRVDQTAIPHQGTEEDGSENSSRHSKAHIMMSYRCLPGVSDHDDFQNVKRILETENMEVIDLQDCELAKVHGRHLVGGRSHAARDEVLCRFEYPEHPGALQTFLHCLPERWNVSLFHYRNHGADVGRILAGLQVPQESRIDFGDFLNKLKEQGYHCHLETENKFYKLFLKHQQA